MMPASSLRKDDGGGEGLRTLQQAAQFLGVSLSTIYRLGSKHELELLKIGERGTRVTQASLDRYVANAPRMIPDRK
jgi:excisionase family DNA binding protein